MENARSSRVLMVIEAGTGVIINRAKGKKEKRKGVEISSREKLVSRRFPMLASFGTRLFVRQDKWFPPLGSTATQPVSSFSPSLPRSGISGALFFSLSLFSALV